MNRILRVALAGFLAGGGAVAAYARLARPRLLSWGATPREARRWLSGDELVRHARLHATVATTVDAPPADIWPWLVQLGAGRAGWYVDPWAAPLVGEAVGAENVLPEHQRLRVGDLLSFARGYGLTAVHIQPERALVLQADSRLPRLATLPAPAKGYTALTLGFYIFPHSDGRTRLLLRMRAGWRGIRAGRVAGVLLAEPLAALLGRNLLHEVAERAEALCEAHERDLFSLTGYR